MKEGSTLIRSKIFIEENSPRDGLQNESKVLSVEERVQLIDLLSECGFPRIQIGSFVNPRLLPQMADTEKVFERIRRVQGTVYSALTLSRNGLERAIGVGMKHVSIFVSASETHSRKNANCSMAEARTKAVDLIELAKRSGLQVQAGVMNAFGCHFEGHVPGRRVVEIAKIFIKCGADEINLADTPGHANPCQIKEVVGDLLQVCDLPIALHLHDTYGLGLVNAYAAWEMGVRRFDASCGGLGGCPFIPGAAGNIASEDIVHLFESMNVPTGIDVEKLTKAVEGLQSLIGRNLTSRLLGKGCSS